MKSTITRLYDYKQSVIPAERLRWRVPDQEIADRLETLSHNHAYEMEPETVQTGDSVACRGESACPRWNRETLLFFPGQGLCDGVLENACLGAKVGERRTVSLPEGEVALTVKRILRRANMPVGDALVQAEHIDGVNTVAEYYDWYRADKREFNRMRAKYQSASFLLDEIKAHSEISIDQEEKDAWMWDRINSLYNALVEAGMDPKIPKEGFDFLTEEQAKEKMYHEQEWAFTDFVVQAYVVEHVFGLSLEDVCREGLEKLAAEHGMTVEALRATSCDSMIQGKFAMEKALDLLGGYTEQFLED